MTNHGGVTLSPSRDVFIIDGGRPLSGDFTVHRAKNSALYLLLASLLTSEPVTLRGVPRLSDVAVTLEILEHLGADLRWHGTDLVIHSREIRSRSAPYRLVSKMRASFVAMGALLGRCGEARISMPGGCAFGPRPVDRHIKAFRDLGVTIREEEGDFVALRERPLEGRVSFEEPTVGGTQNLLLAAALGPGEVVIDNAALEPEVGDLAEMLRRMGADIRGDGTRVITVRGAESLHGVDYRPIPDRIEAGTYLLAAAATRGRLTLHGVRSDHLEAVLAALRLAGAEIECDEDWIRLDASGPMRPLRVTASEYPGIPTDLQAPFSAFMATVAGRSSVEDRVYPDRFTHVGELRKAGVTALLDGERLVIEGGNLAAADLHAADIRAGGALVIAALAARGTSVVRGLEYLDRGYADLDLELSRLGASISRQPEVALATGTYGD